MTALRTAANTALIASACAPPGARTAMVTGSGAQGRYTFPFLLTALPDLDRLLLFGTHPDGIAAVRAYVREQHPDRDIEVVTDPEKAANEADVLVATSAGPATEVKFRTSWLKPGALFVSVNGTGVHSSSLRDADYAVATSAGQLAVTGTGFADENGSLRLTPSFPTSSPDKHRAGETRMTGSSFSIAAWPSPTSRWRTNWPPKRSLVDADRKSSCGASTDAVVAAGGRAGMVPGSHR